MSTSTSRAFRSTRGATFYDSIGELWDGELKQEYLDTYSPAVADNGVVRFMIHEFVVDYVPEHLTPEFLVRRLAATTKGRLIHDPIPETLLQAAEAFRVALPLGVEYEATRALLKTDTLEVRPTRWDSDRTRPETVHLSYGGESFGFFATSPPPKDGLKMWEVTYPYRPKYPRGVVVWAASAEEARELAAKRHPGMVSALDPEQTSVQEAAAPRYPGVAFALGEYS